MAVAIKWLGLAISQCWSAQYQSCQGRGSYEVFEHLSRVLRRLFAEEGHGEHFLIAQSSFGRFAKQPDLWLENHNKCINSVFGINV
ncbi:MAG: hypothetical protein AAF732_12920 [Pseudomonadota bacterium]